MKRDMELVREVLLALEAWPLDLGDTYMMEPYDLEPSLPGYDTTQISYHMGLIRQAGFVNTGRGSGPMLGFAFQGLTWEGHEFLDTIRSPEVWRRTKAAIGTVGGASLSVVGEVAKAMAKAVLKEHLGIDLG